MITLKLRWHYPPRNKHSVQLKLHHRRSRGSGKEKKLLLQPQIEFRFLSTSVRSVTTMPSELYRLPSCYCSTCISYTSLTPFCNAIQLIYDTKFWQQRKLQESANPLIMLIASVSGLNCTLYRRTMREERRLRVSASRVLRGHLGLKGTR